MATTFKEKQEIQKLKKLGLGKTEIAQKLKTTRVTVDKYWDWEDLEKVQLKKPAASEEMMMCPNCDKPLNFVKTDKQIRCPNCDELFNIIRENDDDAERYNKPYKYSMEPPRRRSAGINIQALKFFKSIF